MVTEPIVGQRLVRVRHADGRVRAGLVSDEALAILETGDVLAVLTGAEAGTVIQRVDVDDPETLVPAEPWTLLAPLVAPETWAAGVTYERSREARMHESDVADVYDRVYDAPRPELFLKDAAGRRTVGPGEPIAIRIDAAWSVPEPELAVVLGADGEPLAVTVANDVSARDIEGANPLYLPQAKIYAGACALGPALFVPADWTAPFEIELRILGADGEIAFSGATSTGRMRRSIPELLQFLLRDNPLPAGSVLLTGTGIVPPDDFTLASGQTVEIAIAGIGTLRNPVRGERGRGDRDVAPRSGECECRRRREPERPQVRVRARQRQHLVTEPDPELVAHIGLPRGDPRPQLGMAARDLLTQRRVGNRDRVLAVGGPTGADAGRDDVALEHHPARDRIVRAGADRRVHPLLVVHEVTGVQ